MIPMQWAMRRRMMMAAQGGVDVANMLIEGSCTFTDYGVVTMSDGNAYRLVAITGSGNIVFSSAVNCEVCVVGGGANGTAGNALGVGGAGAYMKNQVIEAFESGAVVVGAAQGVSSIAGVSVAAVSGENGGTGGGGAQINSGGKGDGLSKYPFGDDSYELWLGKPHCAGGAGGGYNVDDSTFGGGNGGSNGANGGNYIPRTPYQGAGGLYGGGNGGPSNWNADQSGVSGSYYGSGAGGGGTYEKSYGSGGSGYQGIVYVRIPVNQ